MSVRGIRGAITATRNARAEVVTRTRELLEAMMSANRTKPRDIAAAFFTVTRDLDAEFPASAAREIGGAWLDVPMMCALEIGVPDSLARVIRVMLIVNSSTPPGKIRHQFLGGTECLRPDLAKKPVRKGRR